MIREVHAPLPVVESDPCKGRLPGIIIHNRPARAAQGPRIVAFVWGGEARTAPVLPFGRWKGAA